MVEPRCIFCGQPLKAVIKAKEHVFPVWLLKRLGISNAEITETWWSSMGLTKSQRAHSIGSILLGNICRSCNNGWMNMLEQRVKPVFLEAFERSADKLVFTEEEAMDLAAWFLRLL